MLMEKNAKPIVLEETPSPTTELLKFIPGFLSVVTGYNTPPSTPALFPKNQYRPTPSCSGIQAGHLLPEVEMLETSMTYPEGLGPINDEMEERIENFNAEEMGGMDTDEDTTTIIEELADIPEGSNSSPVTAEMDMDVDEEEPELPSTTLCQQAEDMDMDLDDANLISKQKKCLSFSSKSRTTARRKQPRETKKPLIEDLTVDKRLADHFQAAIFGMSKEQRLKLLEIPLQKFSKSLNDLLVDN